MTAIAIIGAGKLGTTLARRFVAAGHDVRVTATGDPQRTAFVLDVLVPGARALTLAEAVDGADAVILALPLSRVPDLDPGLLAGRLVLDSTNHWDPVDGHQEWIDPGVLTSVLVQRRLPASRVVKAFSHLGYHDLDEGARPPGASDRLGIAVAGSLPDIADALPIIDAAGFDPVVWGELEQTAALEPGGWLFGTPSSSADIVAAVAARVEPVSA